MISNGNSFGSGSSVCAGDMDDPFVRTLPWIWRAGVPGLAMRDW